MLHRNVLFSGGGGDVGLTLPFSKFDSADPEDLWRFLQNYKDRVEGDVISIPHNSNLSGGNMFSSQRYRGEPMPRAYVALRADLEPIIEVTQIKGDSETHPSVSPDDEFAGYEMWGGKAIAVSKAGAKPALKKGAKPTAKLTSGPSEGSDESSWAKHSYARPALKLGLQHEANLGLNPFKFGMIGSTDSHKGSQRQPKIISGAKWAVTNQASTARSPDRGTHRLVMPRSGRKKIPAKSMRRRGRVLDCDSLADGAFRPTTPTVPT